MLRWLFAVFVGLLVGGCFNPKVPVGLQCSETGECPSGQSCNLADNRCYGGRVEPPGPHDGAPPDAPVDASTPDKVPDAAPPPPPTLPPDARPPDARPPRCGDGVINGNESCDDEGESATCDSDCTARVCGDGLVNTTAGEECDEGAANSNTPDACRTTCTLPSCGDSILDTGEEVDPPSTPSAVVSVDATTCRYDFSALRQLSCNGSCGSWGGGAGCQQQDADALCKLVTGNPQSTATGAIATSGRAEPGICCPPPQAPPGTLGCVHIGNMSSRGVAIEVSVHDTDMTDTHGTGSVIFIDSLSDCTNP